MFTKPGPQHEWLRRLVGAWNVTMSCVVGPDGETWEGTGTEVVRAMGELWVVAEGTGTTPGGSTMNYLATYGYDPQQNKYVGMWAGSPMASMFVYEGVLDETGTRLPLDCTGPAMDDPSKTAHYRDVIALSADGVREHESLLRSDDGSWTQFMTAKYERTG